MNELLRLEAFQSLYVALLASECFQFYCCRLGCSGKQLDSLGAPALVCIFPY